MSTLIYDWVSTAKRGDSFVYAVGEVAYTRVTNADAFRKGSFVDPDGTKMVEQAGDAWRLYEGGKITLVQRRLGNNLFEYIAQRL